MPSDASVDDYASGLVPESCIQSAEYIIQAIATGHSYYDWRRQRNGYRPVEGHVREPHVFAEFGDMTINISTTDLLSDNLNVGRTDYNFAAGEPRVGQGILLLWKRPGDAPRFNLHAGAVVARDESTITVSDMVESRDYNANFAPQKTIVIATADGFRQDEYPQVDYAIALLKVAG